MKIALINGSPKKSGSASGQLLAALRQRLADSCEVVEISAMQRDENPAERLAGCAAAVVAFPLYVDGMPSHLVAWLERAAGELAAAAPSLRVYGVANNGFYEPHQNLPALDMLQNFCEVAGAVWGGGLAVGGGPMAVSVPAKKGAAKGLGFALDTLAADIQNGRTGAVQQTQPGLPRKMYIAIIHFFWRMGGRKNGLRGKDIYRRLV